ncbi:hypothetical protein BD410DRAFT_200950 [Rickenella mellea]|uniref:Piwi domain-containing protein n=1 Tax=Rickenella mellea TaxID=50990 RepID=A0A4Y7Q7M1_9AGAM|nr:hypothetical protein BD410DRAFT_200950 [Rickenella mellea]
MQTVSAAPSDMPLANPPDIFADPSIELQSQQSLQDGTLIGKKFSFGTELSNWAVLMIKDGHELEEFRGLDDPIFERKMATLTDMFVAKGIIIKTQPNYLLADLPRRKASDPRRKAATNVIRAMIKDLGKQLTFLMVFMSRPDERIYSGLKHLCDLYLDVHTICVNSDKILGESKSDLLQRFADVALRVNLKLGGIHDNLSHHSMTLLNQMPTMMVGITTSGPSNLNNAPSVAAVAASVDSFFAQYPASMRIQQWSGTAISGLREMIVERIENFLNISKVLPERLIVFRSNVSNNLLPYVIEEEIREVIQAFKKYRQGTYRPDLTFIICYTREPNESTQRSIREIYRAAPIASAKTVPVEPFYFSSEVPSAIQDTPQRKHYYAVHHEISFTVDQLGQLMDDVDGQLVRKSEEEGVGSPAFYAFRACHRGRCYLRDLYEEIKTGSGKLDSTAVMQKSTELWFGGVRGETLKNSMFYL